MLLFLFRLLLLVIVLWIVITQIVAPILAGTLLFPMFRARRKLEHDVRVAREELEEVRLKKEAANIRSKTAEVEKK